MLRCARRRWGCPSTASSSKAASIPSWNTRSSKINAGARPRGYSMRRWVLVASLAVAALVWASAALIVTPIDVEASATAPYSGIVGTFTYAASPSPTPGPWTVNITWGVSGPTSTGIVTGTGPVYNILTNPITLPAGDISGVTVNVTDVPNAFGGGSSSGNAH